MIGDFVPSEAKPYLSPAEYAYASVCIMEEHNIAVSVDLESDLLLLYFS